MNRRSESENNEFKPGTKDERSITIANNDLQGNLPDRRDAGSEIKESDRSDPIFCIAWSTLHAVDIGNKKMDEQEYNEMKNYFNKGDAESLKVLLGYQNY
jgi:hypothetical protein